MPKTSADASEINNVPTSSLDTEFARLTNLITKIYNLIPETPEYQSVRHDLARLDSSIAYTAPEVIGGRWADLYTFLTNQMPDNRETTDSDMSWVTQIQTLWKTAITRENSLRRQ